MNKSFKISCHEFNLSAYCWFATAAMLVVKNKRTSLLALLPSFLKKVFIVLTTNIAALSPVVAKQELPTNL